MDRFDFALFERVTAFIYALLTGPRVPVPANFAAVNGAEFPGTLDRAPPAVKPSKLRTGEVIGRKATFPGRAAAVKLRADALLSIALVIPIHIGAALTFERRFTLGLTKLSALAKIIQ